MKIATFDSGLRFDHRNPACQVGRNKRKFVPDARPENKPIRARPNSRLAELRSTNAPAMTISADNFLSWPVVLWFCLGAIIVAAVWLATKGVQVMWRRVFFRAAVVALCFAPLPSLEMFGEGAMGGYIAVVPLWCVLFWSITDGVIGGVAFAIILWLFATYLFWVVGMSIHHLFRRNLPPASKG